jgi:hypothetical protein
VKFLGSFFFLYMFLKKPLPPPNPPKKETLIFETFCIEKQNLLNQRSYEALYFTKSPMQNVPGRPIQVPKQILHIKRSVEDHPG